MEVVVKRPTEDDLKELGIDNWPIWECPISEFDWQYDDTETCYFYEGKVIVEFGDGESVEIGKGDLVTFPKGLKCRWKVLEPVRKVYSFG